ncbi:MAG TPA: flagellar hook-length control protein FliK [Caulobacteraceae bacterium]|nr:flagellar hook-length control protein FliK [Caulobacteraceae bacterium]
MLARFIAVGASAGGAPVPTLQSAALVSILAAPQDARAGKPPAALANEDDQDQVSNDNAGEEGRAGQSAAPATSFATLAEAAQTPTPSVAASSATTATAQPSQSDTKGDRPTSTASPTPASSAPAKVAATVAPSHAAQSGSIGASPVQGSASLSQPAANTSADAGASTAIDSASATGALASTSPASAPASAALAQAHGADITSQLAAQIGAKAGAPRSAFEFALEPQGLGRVDVSLRIDQQGQLSAVLSFDNPAAAAEAKGRAADLQQALQQAGVNVSQDGLSFTSSGGGGQGNPAWQNGAQSPAARTPTPSLTGDSVAPPLQTATASSAGGLDITI